MLLEFQFASQQVHQLCGVCLDHLAHRHFHRALVPDDNQSAGDAAFATGEGIKGRDEFFRRHAWRRLDFDFNFFGGEIIDAAYLELSLAGCILYGSDQGFGGCPWGDLSDVQGRGILHVDLGPDFHTPFAILISRGIHETSRREVRKEFKRLFPQDGDLRLQQFAEIVGKDLG